jgi:signal peptidase
MSEAAEEKKGLKPRIKVGKIVAVVLAVLIAYCCIFSLVAKFIKGESVPMPLGFGVAVVLTGSMEPTLHVNDMIVAVKSKALKEGDVIVFQTGGTATIHRLIELDAENGVLVTKGDANNIEDEPITFSKVKGKFLFKIPFIGIAARYLQTVPGTIMMLVLLFTLLFLSVRAKDQDRAEEAKKSEIELEIEALKKQIAEAESKAEEKPEEEPAGEGSNKTE